MFDKCLILVFQLKHYKTEVFEIMFLCPKNPFLYALYFISITYKNVNLDAITNKNNKDDDKRWPYRILIIGPSGSGKTNSLLNLIQKQNNGSLIGKIYLYANDLSDPKYQFWVKKRENAGIKILNDPTAFIEYSNTMDDVYNNIDDYNPKRKRQILIVFDYMIADVMTNKLFKAIIKELFIRCRKLNIPLVFITQSYFRVPKDVRLNFYTLIKNENLQ